MSWTANETKSIRVITDWPNPDAGLNFDAEKVPSVISYGEDGKVKNWGYEVSGRDNALRWLKIMMESGSEQQKYLEGVDEIRQSNSKILEDLGKTADDVVADFLGELWQYAKEDIRKRMVAPVAWEDSIQVVLTVPAVWSGAAKERTLKAAQRAGIGGPISLLSEPEAAALATLSGKVETNTLKVRSSLTLSLSPPTLRLWKLILPPRSEMHLWFAMPAEARW